MCENDTSVIEKCLIGLAEDNNLDEEEWQRPLGAGQGLQGCWPSSSQVENISEKKLLLSHVFPRDFGVCKCHQHLLSKAKPSTAIQGTMWEDMGCGNNYD